MRLRLRGLRRALLPAAFAVTTGLPAVLAAGGGVTTSTDTRTYSVPGTTALALVRSMTSSPLHGDHGAALANIHPDYQLSLTTTQRGGQCVPARVSVHIDFELTLPVAASPGRMNGRTRSAWNAFAAFARAHEGHHKASYIACATAFVAQARRQSADQCFALQSQIRGMLAEMKRDCEAKQVPFDQSQARVLPNLRLFSMARYQRFN